MNTEQLEIETVSVQDLKLDPDNARRHPKENREAIQRSLARFGQVEPILVRQVGKVVIGGNGRLQAMKDLGWKTVKVIYLSLSKREARALGVALNRTGELAKWDLSRLSEAIGEIGDLALDIGFSEMDLADLSLAEQHANADFQDFLLDHAGARDGDAEGEAVGKHGGGGESDHDGIGDEWYTPPEIVKAVRKALGGKIGLDPCHAPTSPVKAERTFDIRRGEDGTKLPWDSPTIFCNPPFSGVGPFLKQGRTAADAGSEVVFLLPIRPETRHWQRWIWAGECRIVIKRGRIKFVDPHGATHNSAMLATAFVVMGPNHQAIAADIAASIDGWVLEGEVKKCP